MLQNDYIMIYGCSYALKVKMMMESSFNFSMLTGKQLAKQDQNSACK